MPPIASEETTGKCVQKSKVNPHGQWTSYLASLAMGLLAMAYIPYDIPQV